MAFMEMTLKGLHDDELWRSADKESRGKNTAANFGDSPHNGVCAQWWRVISYKWEPLREGFDENRKCRSTNAVSGISLHVSIRVHILNFFLPVMFYSSIFGYFIESAIGAYPAEELQCLAEPEHAKATILTWGIEQ